MTRGKIYIIRHGQTDLNQKQVLQGRSNYPLNEQGRAQAREAADRLKGVIFDAVYSSPLIRAIQTAEILAPNRMPIIEERLIEIDYGLYEGVSLMDLPTELLHFFRDVEHRDAPKGMESLFSVVQRAGAYWEECKASFSGNVLISTHAIAMKGLLEYLTPKSQGKYWAKHIGNGEIYVVEYDSFGFSEPRPLDDAPTGEPS